VLPRLVVESKLASRTKDENLAMLMLKFPAPSMGLEIV
jgi:hypothetical protein